MGELEFVRQTAKDVLTVSKKGLLSGDWLWRRAERLVRSAGHIRQLPEVNKVGWETDEFCLAAAAYFCDAGLADYLNTSNGKIVNSTKEDLFELSAEIAEQKLSGEISQTKIKLIGLIIIESGNHRTNRAEAMILSEARNLDDMGATGAFEDFRRLMAGDKDIDEAVQGWAKKKDYGYWQARLRESFRFESVRKLAEKRLLTVEKFINQLKTEIKADDLEELADVSNQTRTLQRAV